MTRIVLSDLITWFSNLTLKEKHSYYLQVTWVTKETSNSQQCVECSVHLLWIISKEPPSTSTGWLLMFDRSSSVTCSNADSYYSLNWNKRLWTNQYLWWLHAGSSSLKIIASFNLQTVQHSIFPSNIIVAWLIKLIANTKYNWINN